MSEFNFKPADLRVLKDFYPSAGVFNIYALSSIEVAKVYGVPENDGAGVKIGIASFSGGFFQSDLELAFTDLRNAGLIPSGTAAPIINQVTLDNNLGLHSNDPYGGNMENILDIIMIATLVPAASITLYSARLIESVVAAAIADGCHFLNFSWASVEQSFMLNYYASMFSNVVNSKLTICAASGDNGSTLVYQDPVEVAFPAINPYVIAVGGTDLQINKNNYTRISEDYDALTQGGGGVSKVYPLPSWQAGLYYTPIVNATTGTRTALTMRGIPDVSAPYSAYGIYDNGSLSFVGGTSAAAPIILGILARIQSLTGKVRSAPEYNKLFYNNKTVFYDTSGGANNSSTSTGYVGTIDWDPLTGLGSPLGKQIYSLLKNGLRPTSGNVFPNYNFDKRPTIGQTWPRRKFR